MSRRLKQPTATSLVVEALRRRDDFMSRAQLLEALPGVNYNQLDAALFHLRKRMVVDVVVAPDGTGWWFALPEDMDQRIRQLRERAIEPPGSRRRRRSKKGDV